MNANGKIKILMRKIKHDFKKNLISNFRTLKYQEKIH